MNRPFKTISIITFIAMIITIGFNNCQRNTDFSSEVPKSGNGTSVGNPLAPASNKILAASCQLLTSCNAQLTYEVCVSGLLNSSGLASTLGLPPQYDTYNTIMTAESAGQLSGDTERANTCSSEILSLPCTDTRVTAAYNPGASSPFALATQLVPKSTCEKAIVVGKKLEVPIEILDSGIASATSVQTFTRTAFNLDTTDYDGTVNYVFEIVSINEDSSPRSLSLVDQNDSAVAQISIPATQTLPLRQSVLFQPTIGANTYRLRLEGTTTPESLKVTEGRILVRQIGATKTKIYVPLVAGYADQTSSSDGALGAVATSVPEGTYDQESVHYYSLWHKDSTRFQQLTANNPYTLEVVLGKTGTDSDSAYASLFNQSKQLQIAESEVTTNSDQPTLLTRSFSDSAANFTNGDEMEVRIKGPNTGVKGAIYRAGLWIKLENLAQGEVYYRYSKTQWIGEMNGQRIWNYNILPFDSTLFGGAIQIFNEMTGYQFDSGAICQHHLMDLGVSDSGTSGEIISEATLNFTSTQRQRLRSPALSIMDGHRLVSESTANPTLLNCVQSQPRLVIQF